MTPALFKWKAEEELKHLALDLLNNEHARTDTVQELPRTVPKTYKVSFTHLCHMKVVWEMLFYDVMIWSHPQLFQQIEIEILEKNE